MHSNHSLIWKIQKEKRLQNKKKKNMKEKENWLMNWALRVASFLSKKWS